jgi:hypothetical protein
VGLYERATRRREDGNGECAFAGVWVFLWVYAGNVEGDDRWDDAVNLQGDDPCLCWALF